MIEVIDGLLPDPTAYRVATLAQPFRDVSIGADVFRGISLCARPEVAVAGAAKIGGVNPALSFFRKSPLGQHEPNYVHSDEMMGSFTGIYFMNPAPPPGDGTAFWEKAGQGEWRQTRLVEARFNRLLIFSAELPHSRALFDNYGQGDAARLIQVVFFKPVSQFKGASVALARLPDWQPRLIATVNDWRLKPYIYGKTDCACFAQACIEAVTGVVLLDGVDKPKGMIGAARFMMARGWGHVEDMVEGLIGSPMDNPRASRPGDLVSFVAGEEPHIAVRIGDAAVSPTGHGLAVIDAPLWSRGWKIG